ncbi:MAG: family 20 glycosylhydrolase [Victivallales bacterium]
MKKRICKSLNTFASSTVLASMLIVQAHGDPAAETPVEIKSFNISAGKEKDSSAYEENGTVLIRRGSESKTSVCAWKDIPAEPDSKYLFSADIKVDGPGHALSSFTIAGSKGAWDAKNIIYSDTVKKNGASQSRTIISTGADAETIKVNLSSEGKNTTVLYQNASLRKIPFMKDLVIKPQELPVEFDGKLDSPFWRNAKELSPFSALNAPEKQSPFKDRVLLSIKDGWLYIGYDLEEPEPSKIRAKENADYNNIYNDDCIELFISANRTSFSQVMVNAKGSKFWKMHVSGEKSADWFPTDPSEFKGGWDAKTNIGENSWTCAIRINLSDLLGNDASGDKTLYMNFTRHRNHGADENYTWAPILGKSWLLPEGFAPVTLSLPDAISANQKSKDLRSYDFTKRLDAPELLMAGKPIRLELRKGLFNLPGKIFIAEKGISIDPEVKKIIEVHGGSSSEATIRLEISENPFKSATFTQAEKKLLESPEAFTLTIDDGGVRISGHTQEGVLRGIATYILMARRAAWTPQPKLPNLFMADAPRMAYRGWMVGGSSTAEFKRTIDAAYLLRLNKLVIQVDSWETDTAYPFTAAEIGGNKFTKNDWRLIFKYAKARGIEPIPYLASWGRVQYITHKPEYAQFAVPAAKWQKNTYRNLDVANPEAVKLMLSIQEELIDDLKPSSLHIAFDELLFGDIVTSDMARALRWRSADWIINSLSINSELLKKKNVSMHLWGDMFDPGQNGKILHICGPELLAKLPKDMVIYDWKYDPNPLFPSIKMFTDAGYRTVGSPWTHPLNIAGIARSVRNYAALGMCQTSWNNTDPEKMKFELRRALSLMSYLSWSPEECDLEKFPFIPDIIFECASHSQTSPFASMHPVASPKLKLSNESRLVGELNFPSNSRLDFLCKAVTGIKGGSIIPFTSKGRPAALIVRGLSEDTIKIPINENAKRLLFLHSVNYQPRVPANLDLWARDRRCNATAASYRIHYSDGSSVEDSLIFKMDIGDVNDSGLGRGMTPALFGTLNGQRFFNLPVHVWNNPLPNKKIESIEIIPGATMGMSLLLFGMSVEE